MAFSQFGSCAQSSRARRDQDQQMQFLRSQCHRSESGRANASDVCNNSETSDSEPSHVCIAPEGMACVPIGTRVRVRPRACSMLSDASDDGWMDGVVAPPVHEGFVTVEITTKDGDLLRKHVQPTLHDLLVYERSVNWEEARRKNAVSCSECDSEGSLDLEELEEHDPEMSFQELNGKRLSGAHCILHDGEGFILMLRDRKKKLWGYPGGKAEKKDGDSAWRAMKREFKEETGEELPYCTGKEKLCGDKQRDQVIWVMKTDFSKFPLTQSKYDNYPGAQNDGLLYYYEGELLRRREGGKCDGENDAWKIDHVSNWLKSNLRFPTSKVCEKALREARDKGLLGESAKKSAKK